MGLRCSIAVIAASALLSVAIHCAFHSAALARAATQVFDGMYGTRADNSAAGKPVFLAQGQSAAPAVPDLTLSHDAPKEPPPEPAGYRMEDFRSTVPLTLKDASVLTADEAADLWNGERAIFIDVYPQAPRPPNLPTGTYWRDPIHRSIDGAHWLANVGYGALSPEMDAFFQRQLERLSKGRRDAPLVFFCLKDCWMSWNAAKRALEYGYTNVMWFRDGTDGWQELGYPLVEVKKVE